MYSIISTLDAEADAKVKQLRYWLTEKHASLRDTVYLDPHMSWLGVSDLNFRHVGEILTVFAQTITPIHLLATGFGIFSGLTPVLYLPVIKTVELLQIHRDLWDRLKGELSGEVRQYRPDQWLPHISLFYFNENTGSAMARAFGDIIDLDFQLHFTLDHFKLAFYKDGTYGLQSEHYFGNLNG